MEKIFMLQSHLTRIYLYKAILSGCKIEHSNDPDLSIESPVTVGNQNLKTESFRKQGEPSDPDFHGEKILSGYKQNTQQDIRKARPRL
jgi:hypothetical protein